ncbi:C-type lectin domain family 17, member A-like isoform X2 [Pecten maximus]|uniref:C-type lectin domain family 17, member A-like isoform X2 n=1 Tax=Pecten maximus TaxID=6579 RepID=UPI0014591685|nr:C-type lectin domain family 17, member A-like isoform X2 [Pecten maximus]
MATLNFVLSVTLLAAFGIQIGLADCPDEWVQFRDSCYFFVNNVTTWHESSKYCQSQNSELVAVESQAENDFLLRYIQRFRCAFNNQFWIDATDMVMEGVWQWASTLETLSYFNWAPNEPNGIDNEDCIIVKQDDGMWNDLACFNRRYFVCERKNIPTSCGVEGTSVIG